MAEPAINYPAWQFWFNVLQLAGLLGLGIYTWWRDREKVTAKRFKVLEADVKERVTKAAMETLEKERDVRCEKHKAETRANELALQQLTGELKHLPSRAEVSRLSENIVDLAAKIGRLDGRLEGIGRVADLMNDFLIGQGGKR